MLLFAVMKQVKNSFWMICALVSAVCPFALHAESEVRLSEPNFIFELNGETPICYTYDASSTDSATSGVLCVANERLGIVFVCDSRSDKTSVPFTLDAHGNLVPAEGLNADQMAWGKIYESGDAANGAQWLACTTPGFFGVTSNLGRSYFFGANYMGTLKDPATPANSPIYAYLVAGDARDAMGEIPQADASIIARYAIAKCGSSSVKGMPAMFQWNFSIGYPSSETNIDPPGLAFDAEGAVAESSWQSVSLFKSLTVTIDGVETTLTTPAEIEAYLTPAVTAFTLGSAPVAGATLADENTSTATSAVVATFELTASSPDLVYYALETRASLSADAPWQSFNDFVKEKGLDNSWQKDYTRLRIDGSALSIPVLSNETGRFYRLRMVNQ